MSTFLKSTKGKILLACVALAVVLAVVLVIVLSPKNAYRSIVIAGLDGKASVSNDKKQEVPAYLGMALFDGDSVAVADGGRLIIELDGDEYMMAEGGTKFRLEATGKAGSDRVAIHLESGSALTLVKNKLGADASDWSANDELHWHDATFERHDLSTEIRGNAARHTFDEGAVTKEPTEKAMGIKTFTCTVCGYAKTEEIPAVPHTHVWGEWGADVTTALVHIRACACGEAERGEHTFAEGVVAKEPTETETGKKTFTCTVCGFTKVAEIPMLPHTHALATERSSNANLQKTTSYIVNGQS